MNYLITYAILGVVVLYLARRERRRFEREAARHAEQHARRDFDKLDALIEATRELPHESYAWGAAERERIATSAGQKSLFRHDCGCRLGSDLRGQPFWLPCALHKREDSDFAAWEDDMASGSGL